VRKEGKLKKVLLLVAFGLLAAVFSAQSAMAQVKGSPGTYSGDTAARAWGLNINGQLGDGTYNDRLKPVAVKNLRGIQTIDSGAGSAHSVALKNDGMVVAWGENYTGQLGDATTTDRTTPVQVSGLSGVKAISAGSNHSLALKTDGTVRAWGANYEGQLGDLSTTIRYTPVQVPYLSGVSAIAAGSVHSLALKSDGKVGVWGDNQFGQLGDGSTSDRHAPILLNTVGNVKAIARRREP
jgi:alpha-tubulin suppressor-like RCC1 family protein